MRGRATDRLLLILLVSMLMGLGVPAPSAFAQDDQADAARYTEVVANRESFPAVAGPAAGELVPQAGGVPATAGTTGPDVQNFVATATFTQPPDLALFDLWDMGFTFRQSEQFVLDSLGLWYYAPVGGEVVAFGNADGFFDAMTAGAVTIDLVVEDTRAMFGFGGTFVAAFDIRPGEASSVAVSAGHFPADQGPGRAVTYSGFQVWALPDTLPPPPSDTAASPDTPSAPTTSSPSGIVPGAADAFANLLAAQAVTEPLSGPFTAILTETPGQLGLSWSAVDLADFHAHAVIGIPEASEIGWSAGFVFRANAGGDLRIGISSLQQWYLSAGADPPALSGDAPGVNLLPGGANGLDLFVQGQTAWLGVNGDLVAIIPLPTEVAAGDVGVASGLYADLWQERRQTLFAEFAVLPLPPEAFLDETAAPADPDSARFLALLAESNDVAPAVGPLSGWLVESVAGDVPTAGAGVMVTDFGAVATFINPVDPSDGTWDSGFQFGGGENANRIVVDSLGDVYVILDGSSPLLVSRAAAYDPGPGNANTLQLFVEGDRALFGVNGELTAVIELFPGSEGDVQVGSAFFNEDFVAGRITDYLEFQVWSIG